MVLQEGTAGCPPHFTLCWHSSLCPLPAGGLPPSPGVLSGCEVVNEELGYKGVRHRCALCVNVCVLLFAHHSGRIKIRFLGLVQQFQALLLTASPGPYGGASHMPVCEEQCSAGENVYSLH